MKKKVLVALMVSCSLIMGCGSNKNSEDIVKNDDINVESEAEVKTEEVKNEVPELSDEEKLKDWSEEYANYFDSHPIMEDNFKASIVATDLVNKVDMNMIMSVVGEDSYFAINNDNFSFDMYSVGDKIYVGSNLEGDYNWVYATRSEESENAITTDSLANSSMNGFNKDNIIGVEYVCDENIDGVVVDILNVTVKEDEVDNNYYVETENGVVGLAEGASMTLEDGTEVSWEDGEQRPNESKYVFKINRDTQEVYSIEFSDEETNTNAVITVETITEVVLPDDIDSAIEVSEQEALMKFFSSFMMLSMGDEDLNLDGDANFDENASSEEGISAEEDITVDDSISSSEE